MENNMNVSLFRPRLLGPSVLFAAAIAFGATVPALAADSSVTQSLSAGSLSASIVDLQLNGGANLISSNAIQTPTGVLKLTADDSRGGTSGAGWSVSTVTSDFVWTTGAGGATNGTNIPANNFVLTSAAAPAMTAGQALGVGGPAAAINTTNVPLDEDRKVITAAATYGQGTYTQDLDVSLTVPASSKVGTYTGTLTTTISETP
jgi:hypothetical protein